MSLLGDHPDAVSTSIQMLPPTVMWPVRNLKRGRTTRTNGGFIGYSFGNVISSSIAGYQIQSQTSAHNENHRWLTTQVSIRFDELHSTFNATSFSNSLKARFGSNNGKIYNKERERAQMPLRAYLTPIQSLNNSDTLAPKYNKSLPLCKVPSNTFWDITDAGEVDWHCSVTDLDGDRCHLIDGPVPTGNQHKLRSNNLVSYQLGRWQHRAKATSTLITAYMEYVHVHMRWLKLQQWTLQEWIMQEWIHNDGVDKRSWVGFLVQQLVNKMLHGINVVEARIVTCKLMYV